jgi:hypothetical protein
VVDILLLQTVSIAIASAGVFVAAVYYVLQLRNQTRMRQSDLLMRMQVSWSSKEFSEAALKMFSTEYKDYDDFVKKYGHPLAQGPVQAEFLMMATYFEIIGMLTKKKLIDMDLVAEMVPAAMYWEKARTMSEGLRKQLNEPKIYELFEYLAHEQEKYFQKLASKKA